MEESILLSTANEESGLIESTGSGSFSELSEDDKKPSTAVLVGLAAMGVLLFIFVLVVVVVALSA
ncbi:hypothetical protein MTO96_031088, partial [Rhipicephalus appendiculatus]